VKVTYRLKKCLDIRYVQEEMLPYFIICKYHISVKRCMMYLSRLLLFKAFFNFT